MAESEIISFFERNKREKIMASISEYRGQKLIDIRIWYKDADTDELKPSKKGVTLSVEKFDDLKKLITDLENVLAARKLLK